MAEKPFVVRPLPEGPFIVKPIGAGVEQACPACPTQEVTHKEKRMGLVLRHRTVFRLFCVLGILMIIVFLLELIR